MSDLEVAVGAGTLRSWASTGISDVVELASPVSAARQKALLDEVDAVAEIPKSIRAGAPVKHLRS